MNICVLRRNRRKTKSHNAPHKRDYILLFVSLAVFFGALTCFAWAVPSRSSPPDQAGTSSASSAAPNSQESVYTGQITRGQNQSSSSAASTSSSTSTSPSTSSVASAPPEPAIAPEEASTNSPSDASTQHNEDPSPQTTTGHAEVYEQEQSYRIVHHTAYREYPVYTTIHHQASTPHEVYSNGKTHIEWTTCPACGAQHSSSYNERVVDHVNEVYCAACGGRHDCDFDEVVYN